MPLLQTSACENGLAGQAGNWPKRDSIWGPNMVNLDSHPPNPQNYYQMVLQATGKPLGCLTPHSQKSNIIYPVSTAELSPHVDQYTPVSQESVERHR